MSTYEYWIMWLTLYGLTGCAPARDVREEINLCYDNVARESRMLSDHERDRVLAECVQMQRR